MEIIEVKKALADRAEDVCRHLLPDGKLEKNEWVGGRLASGDGGHSLRVCVQGEKLGVWKDFGAASTVGGSNLLELWVQVRGTAFLDALNEAKEWLGQRGVHQDREVKQIAKKQYAKPSKKGITWIANKAEFYLTSDRSIPKDVVELYKVAMTEQEDAIVFPYLNHVPPNEAQMIKYLKLERDEAGKKVTWTSKDTPKVLYGKHTRRPSDRHLIITEGEIDAMTWASLRIPGLVANSVPFGAKWEGKDGKDPNDEWIENDWEYLHSFERIYLSMDMDEEGRKAQASIIKRLGQEICFVVELPTKDANELLMAGDEEALRRAFDTAKTLDPAALKNVKEYKMQVLEAMCSGDEAVKRGIPLPFGKYPFHLRWNEWSAITGMNGSGKSQVLGFILVYLRSLGYSSCVGSFEVQPARTVSFYVQQTLGLKQPTREQAEKAIDWLGQGIWLYDRVGETNYHDVLAAFRYAYRRHGVRFFVIDSWMKLGIKGDDFDAQSEVCNAFSDFVAAHDVHLFVVAHPRKLKNENEVVNKMDVKGSGELTDQAHNVLLVWRNKPKEKDIEKMVKMQDDETKIVQKRRAKPDTLLIVAKQRNDEGDEPTIDLWFVKECKQYFGSYRDKGRNFMEEQHKDEPEPTPVAATDGEIDEDQPF